MPRIPVINTSHLDRIDELLVDNFETGEFKLHRSVFTDQALFDLEMKYIFEGNWVYLAHESQIPNNNDYYTTHIGRQPIIIARNRTGELNAMINACSHRGAQLCRYKRGNKATYTCPFHGWTFNNSGKLLKVKDPADAGYSDCFNKDGSHDLKKVARFENYKGFLFGSLNADVPPLEEFLGEATKIIDMIVGQSDEGLAFSARYADYNFVFGKGLNTPTAYAGINERLKTQTDKTGRDVSTYVLFMIIADETDEKAQAKWQNYNNGADMQAIQWLQDQGGKDKISGNDTNIRHMASSVSPVNINMGTLVGSYEKVAAMLDEISEVKGTDGILLTFDDFIKGVEDFGTRIQPLMKSRIEVDSPVPSQVTALEKSA